MGFQRFQNQYPAAHTEAANALITSLRYHQRLEDSENQQDVDAGYTLRAATKASGQRFRLYVARRGVALPGGARQASVDRSTYRPASISGRAPLSERFVAGNSYYLRGWNKYDIDPIGGNRMVHNTVEYRYGPFQVFYDAGAVWDSGQPATAAAFGRRGLQGIDFFAGGGVPR